MFTSVLSYCLPVFGGFDKYKIEALQEMLNKAARLVTHLPFITPEKTTGQTASLSPTPA